MPTRRRRVNKIWWILGIVLVAAIIVIVVLNLPKAKESAPEAVTPSEEKVLEENKKEEVVSEPEEEEGRIEKEEIVQYEGEDPNEEAELSGAVTYAGVSGDYLVIRANIDQYLDTGECRLELRRWDEVKYEETAAIVSAAATATCEGFNVPLTLLAGPHYEIRIYLTSGEKMGIIYGETEL